MVSFRGKKRWAHAQVGHCLDFEQAFETLLEEMKLDTDILDETFTLQLEYWSFSECTVVCRI